MRGAVIENFPKAPGLPKDKRRVSAFHRRNLQERRLSLAVDRGIFVTPALIDRVRQGDWDPDHHEDDRKSRDALAARGYWQAFQLVKAIRRRK